MSDHFDSDITAEFWGPEGRRRRGRPKRDPSLRYTSTFAWRLGALAAVGLMMVPLALALRSPQNSTPVAFADSDTHEAGIDSEVVIVTVSNLPANGPETNNETNNETPNGATSDEGEAVVEGSVRMMSLPILNTPAELKELRRREQCQRTYRVHAGDSWLRIAAAGQIPMAQLLSVNDAQLGTSIHPGEDLCIPAGSRMPSPPARAAVPASTVRPVAPSPGQTAVRTPASQTPVVAPAGPRLSPDQVVAMIREVWPAELQERAIAIAHRESRYRADAYNGWCCYGVFQIYWSVHRSWMSGHGVTSASQLFDARTNIEMAYRIYERAGGWGPWT